MKIDEAFRKYQQLQLSKGLSANTIASTRMVCNSLTGRLGNLDMDDLDADKITRYSIWLKETKAANTSRLHMTVIHEMVAWAHKHNLTSLDPDEVIVPRVKRQPVRFLTYDEARSFIEASSKITTGRTRFLCARNEALTAILYSSGIRISEAVAMNRGSIKNREFIVTGKSKEPRVCFISEKVEKIIKDYLDMRTDTNPALFVSRFGDRLTQHSARSIFRKTSAMSGIQNVHPHTMRHSFATRMLEQGVDIRYIADLLGHQSLETTRIYTHCTNPKLHEIYNAAMPA